MKFAGFYWRIIRVNGDGSLRIIYDGTQAYAERMLRKLCTALHILNLYHYSNLLLLFLVCFYRCKIKYNTDNKSYYLYNPSSKYWTFTPYNFDGMYYNVFHVRTSGELSLDYGPGGRALSPVINLSANYVKTSLLDMLERHSLLQCRSP